MKISTKGTYAIEAVFDLAIHSTQNHETLKNIAKRRKISENYLEQLFMDLKKHGIVKSIRGPQGGYILAKEAKNISCGDVIRAVEGYLCPVACVSIDENKLECDRTNFCPTKKIWEMIRDDINETADSVSLADLLEMYNEKNTNEVEYQI